MKQHSLTPPPAPPHPVGSSLYIGENIQSRESKFPVGKIFSKIRKCVWFCRTHSLSVDGAVRMEGDFLDKSCHVMKLTVDTSVVEWHSRTILGTWKGQYISIVAL